MSTESTPRSEIRTPQSRILYLFTRTPLHIGAGASVGAIDQPIVRERHTGFPVIPASSLKGTFADAWNECLLDEQNDKGETKKVRVKKNGEASDAAWLFGSDDANNAWAGAIQFSEAKLLAFPIRSAKGSFAWITCPLMLQRAVRDGLFGKDLLEKCDEPKDEEAVFDTGSNSKLEINSHIVLEEYTFSAANWMGLNQLSETMANLLKYGNDPLDPVWAQVQDRLVILSNGMMSYFAQNACEVAQHVAIDDDKGTAKRGALFNQENVPSETMFYAVVNAFNECTSDKAKEQRRSADDALVTFSGKIAAKQVYQFGGDASTGLGYCSVRIDGSAKSS